MVTYDPQTVALLNNVVNQAWTSLPRKKQERLTKSLLALRVLEVASHGERNFQKLRDAALNESGSPS